MKPHIIAMGLALAALPTFAQQSHNYNISAFSGIRYKNASEQRLHSNAQQAIQQQFPGWRTTIDKLNGTFRDAFGPALNIPGATLEDKVQYCFTNKLAPLQVNASDWQLTRHTSSDRNAFIGFEQSFNGRKVIFSRMTFTFTTDGRLVRLQMKDYGKPAPGITPTLSAADINAAAIQGLDGVNITAHSITGDWVWFPVPSANGYELRPAWPFSVQGEGKNLPVHIEGYIDGITGTILYRNNKVKETIDQTINGSVYAQNPLLPATDEPLANLAITIGGSTYYTDDNGVFSDAILSAPVSATMDLEGKWSRVSTGSTSALPPSFSNNIITTGTTYTYPNTTPSSDRHVNAYYHVNRVHDFMKGYFPAFTDLDFALPTVVDLTSGNCNAFYNGNSINFYAENLSNGCYSFALCGDIIYHEYGHGISDLFYVSQSVPSLQNGALNEGSSDIWGISITHDPVLGKGSMVGGGIIRRYDLAPKVYPQDIVGEVHADGEIIAGAWWDVAVNIGAVDTMTQLFTKTYYFTPDGPDGTEGEVYHEVLIGALMSDDDDNDLNNGTPHFNQIVSAFARHGIYLLGDATFDHTEVTNQPSNTAIDINTTLLTSAPAYVNEVKIFYRNRVSYSTPYDSLIMTDPTSTQHYTAQLPGQSEGSIMDYYFAVYDNLGNIAAYGPAGYTPSTSVFNVQSTIPYQFGVGLASRYSENFENQVDTSSASANPWKIGLNSDDATKGLWVQGNPIGSYLITGTDTLAVQPGYDHTTGTPSGKCLVTGNAPSTSSAIGVQDVDNGATTVVTPFFDISGFVQPVVEYFRWYGNDRGNNPGNDQLEVMMTDQNAATWKYVDRTYKSDYNWRRRIFAVKDYISSANKIQLKFIASDAIVSGQFQNGQSTVEAAVDDIYIYDNFSATGVPNIPGAKAAVYPNPAHDEINITLAQEANGSVVLYDATGREVARTAISRAQNAYKLNTATLAAGTYMVVIRTEHAIQSQKTTIAH